MAIYHLSVSTRARGYGAAHAAYIERSGKYAGKEDLEASESGNMPAWAVDKPSRFWEAADSFERANGRAYTEIELSLPRELSPEQRVELVREFVGRVIGDRHAYTWAIHNPAASDGQEQPHAHVMFSERVMDGIARDPEQFFNRWNAKEPEKGGAGKDRSMNARVFVNQVREQWAVCANAYLEREGFEVRIDHRSYRDIAAEKESLVSEIEPQMKRGVSVHIEARGVMSELGAEAREVMARNGERVIAKPEVALAALTANQSVFTRRDLERYLMGHTDGAEQFQAAYLRVLGSEQIVPLSPKNQEVVERYTTKSVLAVENRLLERVERLQGARARASVSDSVRDRVGGSRGFTDEQAGAFAALTGDDRIALVQGAAGTGKSYVLSGMREAFEESGFTVHGAILQGKTAEDLERDSGIRSQTLHSFLHGLEKGWVKLDERSVVVVDEAGMVGSAQFEHLLDEIERSGARLRLIGDAKQLHAVAYGNAFTRMGEKLQERLDAGAGQGKLTQIRRQSVDWQRAASEAFSRHEIGAGVGAYAERGFVREVGTDSEARAALLAQWASDRTAEPEKSQIVLAHTNGQREQLNRAIREWRKASGELGAEVRFTTEKGALSLSVGDRLLFGKNDYEALRVKNGTLGTVEAIAPRVGLGPELSVRLDDGRKVLVDAHEYRHLEHGYALTVHKSQGMTVDRAYLLASPSMSAETTYVAMTRHRESVHLFASREAFEPRGGLVAGLARPERKEFSLDYAVLERGESGSALAVPEAVAAPARRAGRVRFEGGMQRALPAEPVAAAAADAKQPDRKLTRAESQAQIAAMTPENQVVMFDAIAKRLADQRTQRVQKVYEKADRRADRRFERLESLRLNLPQPPSGVFAAFKRKAFERELAQARKQYDAAKALTDQAYRLRGKLGQALQQQPLDQWVRERMQRVDPDFVKRVDGFKREAFDRQWQERERVRAQERAKDRSLGKDRDRGMER